MIPDHWSKTASATAGTFSVATTAVQVAELNPWVRLSIGVVTAVSAALAIRFYCRFRRYDNALRWVGKRSLTRRRSQVDDFRFEPASTEAAFAEVCRASSEVYREHNVPEEQTRRWWRQFPEGTFAAYWERANRPPELIAYLSLWPLKPTTYERLRSGKLRERDITYQSIAGLNKESPRACWYAANIVVAKPHRKSLVLRHLLDRAVQHWSQHDQLADRVRVVALGYSLEGEALLRRFGFHMLNEASPDGWPIYELETNTNDLPPRITEALG